jgi:hypothetical protein
MADQKQQSQPRQQWEPGREAREFDNDDGTGHAPESGEPTETGKASMRGAAGADAGKRDESGRQGKA